MKGKILCATFAAAAAFSVAALSGCEVIEQILGGLGHEHVCTTEEWNSDDSSHWHICDECNERMNVEAHSCDETVWEHDTSSHWNECTVCGYAMNSGVHTFNAQNECTVCGYSAGTTNEGSEADILSADLSIHFLELGNAYTGDCTLIKVGDTEVLIDAGSRQSSAATIKSYIDEYCTDGTLEYVIATHSDQDHIAGLVGTSNRGQYNGVLYSYDIETIIRFDLSNKETTTSAGNPTLYGRFLTAVDYAEANGAAVYTGLECWNGDGGAQRTYYLDEEQTVSINILYNYYYEHESSDENNYSVCFLLKQELEDGGQNNYLFTGDLEREGEEYLVQYNELPEVELFKAGHHGSPTSSNDALLAVIKPKNVVVCCCAGSDEYTDTYANQFPSRAFTERVSAYTDNIYVTTMVSDNEDGFESMNGNIVFYFDSAQGEESGSLKLWCSNNAIRLKDTLWYAEQQRKIEEQESQG